MPAAKNWDGRAPFHPETGELLQAYSFRYTADKENPTIWSDRSEKQVPVEFRAHYWFTGTLYYKRVSGFTESKLTVIFTDRYDIEWPVFADDFDKIVRKMVKGKVSGRWEIYTKYGFYALREKSR